MFISGYANTENVFYCLIRGDVQHKGHDCHGAPGVHIVGRAQRELRRKKTARGSGREWVCFLSERPASNGTDNLLVLGQKPTPAKRGRRLRKRLCSGVSWSIDNGRREEQSSFTADDYCGIYPVGKRHFAKPSHVIVINLWLCFWVLWFCFLLVFLFWVFFYFRFRISVSTFSSPFWAPK